jgi:hypothetical protein
MFAFFWLLIGVLILIPNSSNPLAQKMFLTFASYASLYYLVGEFSRALILPVHKEIPIILKNEIMPNLKQIKSYSSIIDVLDQTYVFVSYDENREFPNKIKTFNEDYLATFNFKNQSERQTIISNVKTYCNNLISRFDQLTVGDLFLSEEKSNYKKLLEKTKTDLFLSWLKSLVKKHEGKLLGVLMLILAILAENLLKIPIFSTLLELLSRS